jgi:flagellar protein FliS
LDRNVSKYVTQQVMTAAPATLVFMLYDKAITSLHEACGAIDNGEIEPRWRANNRAIDILTHLWSQLDMDRGGDISKNLNELFPYMITRLAEVDVHNDRTAAEEVIGLLEPLRDAWRDLARSNQGSEEQAQNQKNRTPAPRADAPPARTRISA